MGPLRHLDGDLEPRVQAPAQVGAALLRLALAVAVLLGLAGPARAGQPQVQPGALVRVGAHACTLGFVFDGIGPQRGREFISTASHCVDYLEQPARTEDGDVFGAVAYIAPARSGPGGDFALIAVRSRWVARVRPYLRGNARYPSSFTRATETTSGESLRISGYGDAYDATPESREERTARLRADDDWEFRAVGPIGTGDSGAPLVSLRSGKALGIVADLCFGPSAGCDSARGPTVQGMLESARRSEFPVRLRRAGDPLPREVAATVPRRAQALRTLRVRPRVARRGDAVRAVFYLRAPGQVRLRVDRRVYRRWQKVTAFTRRGRRGTNSVRLPRRVVARLRAGLYRVAAAPRSPRGRPARPRFATFRVTG